MKAQTTVDQSEIERFTRMADEWWDERGKFAPLHRMNPTRIAYIKDRIQDSGFRIQQKNSSNPQSPTPNPLEGVSLLDIGCGGGLICEPMARLGAKVTGIDAGEKNIAIAKLHAEASGLDIDYRCTTAEALLLPPTTNHQPPTFDVVLALEIIEHVADVNAFIAASCKLVKPGGLIIYSTLNRTPKSYALAIIGAEYIMRWLPIGTHDWKKFLKPHELVNPLRSNGVEIVEMTGMVYNPLTQKWRLDSKDLDVNYLVVGKKA